MSTNWKDIGKNSGNMSQYRNVTHQKLSYENGNLNTIYDISGIKTKGYIFDISGENIVLGVGTDKPFSRLSLGNNADSGVFNPQKPGQLAAIALDESDTGNGFSGIVLNSKIKTLNNSETKGLQLISSQNNFSMDDSTMGRIILSNENVTTIGGNSRKKPGGYSDSTAGMNIVLDVRGSIRTDGYINFFDKPSDDTNQETSPSNGTWTEQFDKIPPGSLFLKENKDSISDEGLYFKNSSGVEIQVAGGGGGGGGGGVGTSSSVFDVSSQGGFTFIAANGTGVLGKFGGHPVTFSGESDALPTDPATSYFNNAVTIKEGNLAVITQDGKLLKVVNPNSDLTYFSKPGGIILAEKQLLIGKTALNSNRFGYGLIDIQSVETVPSMLCTNNSSIPFEPTAATNSIMLLTRETVSPYRTTGDIGQTYDCSNTIMIGSANFLNIDTPNSIISINPYLESRGDGSKIVDISGSNLIFGANNDLSASPFSIIFGTGNEIDSTNKTVDSPEGKENVALGTNNRLFNSQNSFVQGTNNVNYGNLNVIFGKQNKIGNEEGTWNGGKESDHFQYSGSNCFIQGNNNIIKAPYDISVNNAFIAGYGNILDCSGSSFVKNPEASYVLLGSKARIDQSDFTNDSSNVRFAFGTRESNRNVFTIDKDGNVVIDGDLLVKGTHQTVTQIIQTIAEVTGNNLSLNKGPYSVTEGAAEGGGITLIDTWGGDEDKGLIWNSSPIVHGSKNYWHTKGSDISTNDLFANSIIANDISGNDARFNDLSLNYLYVNGNIKADALHLTPSTGLRTGGAPGSIILGDLTSGTAGGEYSVSAGQNNTSTGYASIAMGQNNESTGNYSVALGNMAYAGDNIRFAIGISDTASTALATSGSGNNNKFVIDVSGNVGIGTDTPSEKLEVNGNIKVRDIDFYHSPKWTENTSTGGTKGWNTITSSSDGTKLAACVRVGNIWTSVNSGLSWTENTTTGVTKKWYGITSSSDGKKLAADAWGGKIWTSDDYGLSWTENATTGDAKDWHGITSSSDGKNLAAIVYGGNIWTSDDSGLSWSKNTTTGDDKNWYSITSSSDGTKLAACDTGGKIWTSVDSGLSWTERGDANGWYGITSSSDGAKLAACVYDGNIWTSDDYGENWTENTSIGVTKEWRGITSSSDGTKLAAVVESGN